MSNLAYELSNVAYGYGNESALHLDSLQIEKGTVTALLGANGAGKSTLLNILAFLHRPDRGEVCFFGEPVKETDYPDLRRRIAYVQQKPYLFNTSVLDNIELGLKLRGVARQRRRQEAERMIRQCHIERLARRRAHELSTGEVQKVAIARAMILSPEVLLLDEPFNHLDAQSRHELERLLDRIRQGQSQTVVLSAHEPLQVQQLAQAIYSLEHGRLAPAAGLNLFFGLLDKERAIFDTGRIKIHIPAHCSAGERLAIEPGHLVISREKLLSSMRNSYSGRLSSLHEEGREIHLIIEAGEKFHAMITHAALKELGLGIGDTVWVSFKSSAVRLY